MELDAGVLRGRILAAWREFAGLEVDELAERAGLSRRTIESYEDGSRRPRDPRDEAAGSGDRVGLAEALGLEPAHAAAFDGMLNVAGSPAGGPPRCEWSRNFDRPGQPIWAWLRAGDPDVPVTVHAWWSAALQGEFVGEPGLFGLMATSPYSVSNPPLEVRTSVPVWVDFGYGTIPAEVATRLGVRLIDPRHFLFADLPRERRLGRLERNDVEAANAVGRMRVLVREARLQWRSIAPHLGMLRHPSPEPEALLPPAELGGEGPVPADVERVWDGRRQGLEAARVARGLSRDGAAELVSELDHSPDRSWGVPFVSADVIRNLEGGREPREQVGLIAALDVAYGLDGRLGLERTFSSKSVTRAAEYEVKFPAFYSGPVWIWLTSTEDAGEREVGLRWGPWRRPTKVVSGVVLRTRKSGPGRSPLMVVPPVGWWVECGTGYVEDAVDINHGWFPASLAAGLGLLREALRPILRRRSARAARS